MTKYWLVDGPRVRECEDYVEIQGYQEREEVGSGKMKIN